MNELEKIYLKKKFIKNNQHTEILNISAKDVS